MDSKSSIPTSFDEASSSAPPPAYTETIPLYQTSHQQPQSSTSQSQSQSHSYSHQIQHQLHSITTQLKSLETQKTLLSHARDEKILSLLTTQIQTYLADFATTGLRRGTLILVPAGGIADENNAVPVEFDFTDPSEYDRVVRVRDKEANGESLWFWRDEEMARRLAGYLRPRKDLKNVELPPRKEEVAAAISPSSSRGFWGRKKSTAKDRPPLIEEEPRNLKSEAEGKTGSEYKVVMDIKAEEVVFRTENDLGLYETERGWGIVLKLRVLLGQR